MKAKGHKILNKLTKPPENWGVWKTLTQLTQLNPQLNPPKIVFLYILKIYWANMSTGATFLGVLSNY